MGRLRDFQDKFAVLSGSPSTIWTRNICNLDISSESFLALNAYVWCALKNLSPTVASAPEGTRQSTFNTTLHLLGDPEVTASDPVLYGPKISATSISAANPS